MGWLFKRHGNHSTSGLFGGSMQVGDLVKRKVTGQFFIYCGTGTWTGWGEFANFKGRIRQLQVIEMEMVEKK